MESVLNFFKKLIPKSIFRKLQPAYHFSLAFLGGLFYGFPSKNLVIMGVTGTKGKTTTCNLIHHILNSSGRKTGLATTVNFKIGDREWLNQTKQTMLGRFQLQKLLRQMIKEGCAYAVIETSSEGIVQFRHRFIDFSVAIFTNITPEHIERHGGFHLYRQAKVKLFEKVAQKPNGIGIYNLDDENVEYFLKPKIKTRIGYTAVLPNKIKNPKPLFEVDVEHHISNISLSEGKTEFAFDKKKIELPLLGQFNAYNAAAAISTCLALGVSFEQIRKMLKVAEPVPGRMELINKGQNFTVIVDYAHEPASLEAVYKTIKNLKSKKRKSNIICLLGGQGGGRDKWKRGAMGKLAGDYCSQIILTNEDPYDENPNQILADIQLGIGNSNFQIQPADSPNPNFYKILDRREAIKKAISRAKKGDTVILTGKGGEVWMCMKNNQKIPWDETETAEELLEKLLTA